MTEENPQATAGEGPQFGILRTYLKDVSFETPNSPAALSQSLKSQADLQLNSRVAELEDGLYEVVLTVNVTSKEDEKTLFLVEIQQAGLFTVKGFDGSQKDHLLGAYCPNILYPFAREAVADLVAKGGFPQLLLAPINFDALYAQNMTDMQAQIQANEPSPY